MPMLRRQAGRLWQSGCAASVKTLLAAFCVFLFAPLHALAAEAGAPDFRCPYDGQTLALLAAGTRVPAKGDTAVYAAGVSGQALTVGSPDGKRNRSLYYPVADLLDARAGSASFWVQPLDWKGGDAPFHVMLRTMAGETYFMVYKFFNSNTLLFLLGPQGRWTGAKTAIPDWGPGQWHHVACTWSETEVSLWVDGQPRAVARLRYPIPAFRGLEPLSVGPGTWGDGSVGTSLIDEVCLYRRVLAPGEIEALYRRDADRAGVCHESGLLVVGRCTPVLDGKVGEAEYAFSSAGFLGSGGALSQRQGRIALGYDDQRLYLAVSSPLTPVPRPGAGETAKAGRLEVYLAPATARQPLYRFTLAAAGTVAATRDGDTPWPCAGVETRHAVADGTWTAEAAIPFAALGLDHAPEGQNWRANVARIFTAPPEVTTLAPVVGGPDDWSHFLTMRFRHDTPTVRIAGFADVAGRALQVDVSASSGPANTVTGCIYSSTGRAYEDRTTAFTLWTDGRATPFRPLRSPVGAETRYQLALDEKVGADSVPLFRGSYVFDPAEPLTVLSAYTLHASHELLVTAECRGQGRVRVRFLGTGGTVVLERLQPVPAHTRFASLRFELDMAVLTPGDYRLRIDHVAADGTVSGSFEQEYRAPRPADPRFAPYVDPEADTVPPPWTPLQSDATSVRMWGRRYDLAEGVLVSGLASQGQELLAAPVRLRLDGKVLTPVSPPTLRQTVATPVRAEWEKRSDLGPLQLHSHLTVHFDGYCEVALRLRPATGQPLTLQRLALEFPLRGEAARLVRDSFVSYGGKSGAVAESWSQTLADLPLLWVGNEQVGLNWVANDLSQWHYRRADRNVEIRRDGEVATLAFNLVDTPLALTEPRTVEFGFVVTPSRPLEPRLRRGRTDREWQMWCQPWKYFGYVDAEQIEEWRLAADCKGHDEAFLYLGHGFASPFCPEWPYWEEEWRHSGRAYGEFTGNAAAPAVTRDFSCYAEACLRSDSFRNFHLHQLQAFFARAPVRPNVRNYYFDFSFGVGCNNAHHGCLPWLDLNGKPHVRVLNPQTREVTLATYRMIKRSDPDARISSHLGFPRDLPVQHFSEILVVGEGTEPEIATRGSYYDILTPETFRATYLPQVWGMKVVFINQLVRSLALNRPAQYAAYSLDQPETRRALLHLIGYLTVHDVEGWWADLGRYRPAIEALWSAQDRLGWDEAVVFHPYWQPEAGVSRVRPDSSRVLASAYTRRGNLLLAVLNDTNAVQDVVLRLDLGKLGVAAGASGQDFWQPASSYPLSDTWQDTVGPRGFRLIVWTAAPASAAPQPPAR